MTMTTAQVEATARLSVGVWFQSQTFSHIHGHMLLVSTTQRQLVLLLLLPLLLHFLLTVCHFDFMF